MSSSSSELGVPGPRGDARERGAVVEDTARSDDVGDDTRERERRRRRGFGSEIRGQPQDSTRYPLATSSPRSSSPPPTPPRHEPSDLQDPEAAS